MIYLQVICLIYLICLIGPRCDRFPFRLGFSLVFISSFGVFFFSPSDQTCLDGKQYTTNVKMGFVAFVLWLWQRYLLAGPSDKEEIHEQGLRRIGADKVAMPSGRLLQASNTVRARPRW